MRASRLGVAMVGAGVALLGACIGESEEESDPAADSLDEVGESRAAIVGGHLEPGRSAVVAIVHASWDPSLTPHELVCSGVLITPNIVVTAAHCLHPHVTGYEPDELEVFVGPNIQVPDARLGIESGAYNPAWRVDDPEGTDDIGAVRLVTGAPIDPIAIGPAPVTGGQVVLVGYGATSPEGSNDPMMAAGLKRSGDAMVGHVESTWFQIDRAPSTTCAGDSGGATLADINGAEVLIGIHSRGDCVSELWNERVDAHANGFLKQFMGQFGGCNADGACAVGCPSPDPDCPCGPDGECDVACGAGEDPDCEPASECEDLPPDGSDVACCDDGACDDHTTSSANWGAAGCAVPSSGAGGDLAPWLGLAALSLAFRRRSARGGSSRSGS